MGIRMLDREIFEGLVRYCNESLLFVVCKLGLFIEPRRAEMIYLTPAYSLSKKTFGQDDHLQSQIETREFF